MSELVNSTVITKEELLLCFVGNKEDKKANQGALQELAIDRCNAFFSGQVTSSFTRAFTGQGPLIGGAAGDSAAGQLANNVLNTGAAITNAAFTGFKLYNDIYMLFGTSLANLEENDSALEIYQDAIKNMVNYIVDRLIKDIIKHVEQLTANIIQLGISIPTKIGKYSLDYFNKHKRSLNDILLSLGQDPQEVFNKKTKKKDDDEQQSFIKRLTTNVNKILIEVNTNINKVAEYISHATYYIEEGPDYLLDRFNDIYGWAEYEATIFMNNFYAKADEKAEEFCKKKGEKLGKKLVREYEKAIEKTAARIINNRGKTQKNIFIKTKIAAQVVTLKILGKFGL